MPVKRVLFKRRGCSTLLMPHIYSGFVWESNMKQIAIQGFSTKNL